MNNKVWDLEDVIDENYFDRNNYSLVIDRGLMESLFNYYKRTDLYTRNIMLNQEIFEFTTTNMIYETFAIYRVVYDRSKDTYYIYGSSDMFFVFYEYIMCNNLGNYVFFVESLGFKTNYKNLSYYKITLDRLYKIKDNFIFDSNVLYDFLNKNRISGDYKYETYQELENFLTFLTEHNLNNHKLDTIKLDINIYALKSHLEIIDLLYKYFDNIYIEYQYSWYHIPDIYDFIENLKLKNVKFLAYHRTAFDALRNALF